MARPTCKSPEHLLTILSANWQPLHMIAYDLFRDDRETANRMLMAVQTKLHIGIQWRGDGRKRQARIDPADNVRAQALALQCWTKMEAE